MYYLYSNILQKEKLHSFQLGLCYSADKTHTEKSALELQNTTYTPNMYKRQNEKTNEFIFSKRRTIGHQLNYIIIANRSIYISIYVKPKTETKTPPTPNQKVYSWKMKKHARDKNEQTLAKQQTHGHEHKIFPDGIKTK